MTKSGKINPLDALSQTVEKLRHILKEAEDIEREAYEAAEKAAKGAASRFEKAMEALNRNALHGPTGIYADGQIQLPVNGDSKGRVPIKPFLLRAATVKANQGRWISSTEAGGLAKKAGWPTIGTRVNTTARRVMELAISSEEPWIKAKGKKKLRRYQFVEGAESMLTEETG